MAALIDERAFQRVAAVLDEVRDTEALDNPRRGRLRRQRRLVRGAHVIQTTDPTSRFMKDDFFGLIVTVYMFEDQVDESVLELVDSTGDYGLTGSVFATQRSAVQKVHNVLRYAGNLTVNDKPSGGVVGRDHGFLL